MQKLLNHKEKPFVSVLMGVYNQELYIEEAVQSVLCQEYENLEIIIVNDGSTDKTEEKIVKNNKIKYIYQENSGQAAALNTAYENSKGEWVFFLDGDDRWSSNKISSIIKFVADSDIKFVHHSMFVIDNKGERTGSITPNGKLVNGRIDPKIVFSGECRVSPTSGVAMRRDLCNLVFPIPELMFKIRADYYLQVVSSIFDELVNIRGAFGEYRIHESNKYTGSNNRAKFEKDIQMMKWMRDYLKINYNISVNCTWSAIYIKSTIFTTNYFRRFYIINYMILDYISFSVKHKETSNKVFALRLMSIFLLLFTPNSMVKFYTNMQNFALKKIMK